MNLWQTTVLPDRDLTVERELYQQIIDTKPQPIPTPRPADEAPQRTAEYWQERLGHATASKAKVLITEPRSKADREAGLLSDSATSYLLELLAEHLTGVRTASPDTWATEWGNTWEKTARDVYTEITGRQVQECGFIKHPALRGAGASPDGLVGDVGLVEIKCPYTMREHLRTVTMQAVPKDYIAQIQYQMWVCDREWCDFVSYDPRQERPEIAFCCVRAERDDDMIAALQRGTRRLLEKLEAILADLGKRKPVASEAHAAAHAAALIESEPEPEITTSGTSIWLDKDPRN